MHANRQLHALAKAIDNNRYKSHTYKVNMYIHVSVGLHVYMYIKLQRTDSSRFLLTVLMRLVALSACMHGSRIGIICTN